MFDGCKIRSHGGLQASPPTAVWTNKIVSWLSSFIKINNTICLITKMPYAIN